MTDLLLCTGNEAKMDVVEGCTQYDVQNNRYSCWEHVCNSSSPFYSQPLCPLRYGDQWILLLRKVLFMDLSLLCLHDTVLSRVKHINIFISVFTNLMRKICFTLSFISCLYMFRAHVLETCRGMISNLLWNTFCASSWLNTEINMICVVCMELTLNKVRHT